MKKMFAIILMMLMVLNLVACGSEPMEATEDITELTTEVGTEHTEGTEPSEANESVVQYNADQWEYYYYDSEYNYSRSASEYKALHNQLFAATYDLFCYSEFDENHELTLQFYEELEAASALYDQMVKIYLEVRMGERPDVTVEEMLDLMYYDIDCGWACRPLVTIEYDKYWVEHYKNATTYDREDGFWDYHYGMRYADGLFELDSGYSVWVEASQNMVLDSGNKNTDSERDYTVEDPSKDAWLFIEGDELIGRIVYIKAAVTTETEITTQP